MGVAELVFIGLFIVSAIVLIGAGIALITLLVHAIAFLRVASKPPHADSGEYRLDQGREVRAEERDA
jgi:hypothetical protein